MPSPSPIVVAIDGPAGSGKSTAALLLAHRLGYMLLDTGAIYRVLAMRARQEGVSWDDEAGLARLAAGLDVSFALEGRRNRVMVDGREVTAEIRVPEAGEGASRVSRHPEVRRALLLLQRRAADAGGVVAEGRDVGTVVFPQAEAKFFLTASPEVRARRRFDELRAAGHQVDLATTLQEQEVRDQRDQSRAVAPLRQAEDAVVIDSSGLGPEAVAEAMERVVRQRLAANTVDKRPERV